VVLAPRGYRVKAGVAIRRVTCSYAATPGASAVLLLAAAVANRFGTALRIATFGVRGKTMYPPETGLHSEDVVLTEWRSQATTAQQEALAELDATSITPKDTTLAFGAGSNWTDALEDLEWDDGEILVIGSSPIGPLARVFLGSRATKIVRHSPVPVVVVPSVEAAEEATEKLV
jgi:nucleotide-binding universal stress UspA family protein